MCGKSADGKKKTTSEGFSRVNAKLIRFLRLCGQKYIIITLISFWRQPAAVKYKNQDVEISGSISYLSPGCV